MSFDRRWASCLHASNLFISDSSNLYWVYPRKQDINTPDSSQGACECVCFEPFMTVWWPNSAAGKKTSYCGMSLAAQLSLQLLVLTSATVCPSRWNRFHRESNLKLDLVTSFWQSRSLQLQREVPAADRDLLTSEWSLWDEVCRKLWSVAAPLPVTAPPVWWIAGYVLACHDQSETEITAYVLHSPGFSVKCGSSRSLMHTHTFSS